MRKLNNTLAPTTIPDLPYPASFRRDANKYAGPQIKSHSHFPKRTEESGEPKLPYPFLSGLCDRNLGNRFSKRVIFDRTDYDNLLDQIVD